MLRQKSHGTAMGAFPFPDLSGRGHEHGSEFSLHGLPETGFECLLPVPEHISDTRRIRIDLQYKPVTSKQVIDIDRFKRQQTDLRRAYRSGARRDGRRHHRQTTRGIFLPSNQDIGHREQSPPQ